MKKIVLPLTLIALFSILASFALFTFLGKPVEFSEKTLKGRDCYIDVVEMIPKKINKDTSRFYYQCICANGDTVWMDISAFDYDLYFASEIEDSKIDVYPQRIKFDTPVRFNGEASVIKDGIEDNKSVKVFSCYAIDEETIQNATKSIYGAEYNESLDVGTVTTVDILEINPESRMTEYGYGFPQYYWMCKCTTVTNNEVYVIIDADMGNALFGFPDSLSLSTFYEKPKAISFVQPITLLGYVSDAKNEIADSSSYSNLDKIILLAYADAEAISASKMSNQPAIEYTESSAISQNVYLDIKSVQAYYEVTYYNTIAQISSPYYVCKCERADGTEVWVCFITYTYRGTFFGDISADVSAKVELENLRIYGQVQTASYISDDLPDKIGTDKIIIYSRKD